MPQTPAGSLKARLRRAGNGRLLILQIIPKSGLQNLLAAFFGWVLN
jgi:hypothetical protein